MIIAVALVCLICALVPAVMMIINLQQYLPAPAMTGDSLPAVSILIPARNEAQGIGDAVRAALTTRGVAFEVVVMDDGSTDGTVAIVQAIARGDARVRLEHAPLLAAGWNGKQHACWALAHVARHPVLCFVDADVRLQAECVGRMAQFLESSGSSLVSGFPRQITRTWMEWTLLPLIHFVLLGFLPITRMRAGTDPSFAAGCGQFMMARAEDYFACGGHSGIKLTMHDGLRLPRLFREAGFRTDLADMTELATCRMYQSMREVWSGLAKNATEGLANPARIVPVTFTLLMGQVVPFLFLAAMAISLLHEGGPAMAMMVLRHHMFIFGVTIAGELLLMSMVVAVVATWGTRVLALRRFRQDWRSAALHPFGIVLLLSLQWYALARKFLGSPVSWRGRAYAKPHAG